MKRRYSIWKWLLIFCLVTAFTGGCVSIPKESASLSSEIGVQIAESKAAHLALMRQYLAEKREQINTFVSEEWLPEFVKRVFEQEGVKKAWNQIVEGDDMKARFELITGLGIRLQKKIDDKRRELIQPINALEQLFVERIENHYDTLLSANNRLTTFLNSAVKVKDRQHETLKTLGVEKKFSQFMSSADDIVKKIISGRDAYEKNKEKINRIIDRIR
ncbi:MAG: hypothetical protein ACE5FY_06990 [Nitrospiria bacterium]